jgi:hypothetical protein
VSRVVGQDDSRRPQFHDVSNLHGGQEERARRPPSGAAECARRPRRGPFEKIATMGRRAPGVPQVRHICRPLSKQVVESSFSFRSSIVQVNQGTVPVLLPSRLPTLVVLRCSHVPPWRRRASTRSVAAAAHCPRDRQTCLLSSVVHLVFFGYCFLRVMALISDLCILSLLSIDKIRCGLSVYVHAT